MGKGVSIQVQGLKELKAKFGKIPENVVREVDAVLADVANDFVNNVVAAVPIDTGFLENGITQSRIGVMRYEVVSAADYSAYVEFGTITKVRVPAGLEDFALQFKGRGIRKNGGLEPHPYFFPQLPLAQAKVNKDIAPAVQRALSK